MGSCMPISNLRSEHIPYGTTLPFKSVSVNRVLSKGLYNPLFFLRNSFTETGSLKLERWICYVNKWYKYHAMPLNNLMLGVAYLISNYELSYRRQFKESSYRKICILVGSYIFVIRQRYGFISSAQRYSRDLPVRDLDLGQWDQDFQLPHRDETETFQSET